MRYLKKFNENNNEWLTKYKYPSDNIRFFYIQKYKFSKVSDVSDEKVNYKKLTDIWDGYDDLLFVRNRGGYIDFYEGFVDSCWEELYKKDEYKGLSKKEAVDLMKVRFDKIANDLSLEISLYEFKNNYLYIRFDIIGEFKYEDPYVSATLYNNDDGRLEILDWNSKNTLKGGTEISLKKLKRQYPIIDVIDVGYRHEDSFKYWQHMLSKNLITSYVDDDNNYYSQLESVISTELKNELLKNPQGFNTKNDASEYLSDIIKYYDSLDEYITLYRILFVENEDVDVDIDNLGNHWSINKNVIYDKEWVKKLREINDLPNYYNTVYIEAIFNKSDINWELTLDTNINFPNEEEIFVDESPISYEINKLND